LEVREAVDPTTGSLPMPSCIATTWTNGSTQSRALDATDLGSSIYDVAAATFNAPSGGSSKPEICFTPRGRTWYRPDGGSAFVQLTGVPTFTLTNTFQGGGGHIRTVYIPPNGVARLQL
jgi:type IV fimbrial biogenesis protein FimT